MSKTQLPSRAKLDWAEDGDDDDAALSLPAPQVTKNRDGSITTTVSWKIDELDRKIKVTRRVRTVIIVHRVNANVARRKDLPKFGDERGKPSDPNPSENVSFRPHVDWKAAQQEAQSALEREKKAQGTKKINCRICGEEHFTSKCNYKEAMAPEGEIGNVGGMGASDSGMGGGSSSNYIAPHLRGKGNGAGERMGGSGGGRYERDDLATLRVTNVSETAEEDDLRELFERYGAVNRVFLARDRDTGKVKGFAFVSYADRGRAEIACEKLDGVGYQHLILRVEFSKKST